MSEFKSVSLDRLFASLANASPTIESLQSELAALRAENERLNNAVSHYKNDQVISKAQYDRAITRLALKDETIDCANMVIGELKSELSALRNTEVTRADLIREMANKLMGWKLPKDFSPDAGISFTPRYNVGTPYERDHEPIGTNLFHVGQAQDMFDYCLPENYAAPPIKEGFVSVKLVDDLVEAGQIIERYSDPKYKPLSEESFRFYDSSRKFISKTKAMIAASQEK